MKRIAILGSTGSIGIQTLDICRAHPDRFKVVALAAHHNVEAVRKQAAEFGVQRLAMMDPSAAQALNAHSGIDGISHIATLTGVDIVVVCVSGVIGLLPTLAAIRAGKQIALASKEVLVAAGEVVMPLLREHSVLMTPIDSEHSALFQCLLGSRPHDVHSLILTASGGPFRGKTRTDLEQITPAQALNHPTWSMGGKITVDSATLMNKGLEMIEARWLFDVPVERIDVCVHPQSIVHSFVKFNDGSVLGQCGWPNMRLPILFALSYPDRVPNDLKPWNPTETSTLTFEPPDLDTFRSLHLAREAARIGGTMPCVLNAANEDAANAFLRGECGFLQMMDVVEEVMSRHTPAPVSLEVLLEFDAWARHEAQSIYKSA